MQRSHERVRRLLNQQQIGDYERLKLTAQLGDLDARYSEVMGIVGTETKRKEIRKELYQRRYRTLSVLSEKEILESSLESDQIERLIAVKSAMPSYHPRQDNGRLQPDDIWRSELPEDVKRRLAQHIVDRIERQRDAEREGVALDMDDYERARQAERDAAARSMGDWGRGRGR